MTPNRREAYFRVPMVTSSFPCPENAQLQQVAASGPAGEVPVVQAPIDKDQGPFRHRLRFPAGRKAQCATLTKFLLSEQHRVRKDSCLGIS